MDFPHAVLDLPGMYEEARLAGWSPIKCASVIGEAVREVEGEAFASDVPRLLLDLENKNRWPIHKPRNEEIF